MAIKYAERVNNLKKSEIRELMKLMTDPEIISFSGGMPANELFPNEEMKAIAIDVYENDYKQAMQYGTTDGYPKLREQIAKRMQNRGMSNIKADDILVTSGGQQALDFVGKVFLDKGDAVVCESPSYLGAINAFDVYQPEFIEIKTDESGMIISELEKALEENKNIRFIYVIPNFQNPSGRTWTLEKRKSFMEVINKYEIPVVEDDPYGDIRFEGKHLPTLKQLDTKGLVIYLGSFSKILAPGYRLGWASASEDILDKLIMIKQGSDLQASSISQIEVSKYIEKYDLDEHVNQIKKLYKSRKDLMIKTMQEEFPKEVKFTNPEGGLFLWVTLPEYMDASEMFLDALKNKVAYVAGNGFFPNEPMKNTMRLNYSSMPEEKIVKGIKLLAEVIKSRLK